MKKLALLLSLVLVFGLAPTVTAQEYPDNLNGVLLAYQQTHKEAVVYFNTQSRKYHSMGCKWAARCSKNCIQIPLSEAINRGGVSCKVCGGGQ